MRQYALTGRKSFLQLAFIYAILTRQKNALLSSCCKALSPDFRLKIVQNTEDNIKVDKSKCKRTKLFQKVATPLKEYCFFITENKSVNVFHCKQCTLEMYLLDLVSFVLFTSKCSLVFYFLKERTLGKQRFVSSINLQQAFCILK